MTAPEEVPNVRFTAMEKIALVGLCSLTLGISEGAGEGRRTVSTECFGSHSVTSQGIVSQIAKPIAKPLVVLVPTASIS